MKTVRPVFFYPVRRCGHLIGTAQQAPSGLPVTEVSRAVLGRGKNKVTRVLIQSSAPDGWGEWSGRAMFAYVDAEEVQS